MGIKNINTLLKAKNQTGIVSRHISYYTGKRIGIDFSNYIYKFIIAVLLTPTLYILHYLIDLFLGKELSEKLIKEAAESSKLN